MQYATHQHTLWKMFALHEERHALASSLKHHTPILFIFNFSFAFYFHFCQNNARSNSKIYFAAKELNEDFLSSSAFCSCSTLVEVDLKNDKENVKRYSIHIMDLKIHNIRICCLMFHECGLLCMGSLYPFLWFWTFLWVISSPFF